MNDMLCSCICIQSWKLPGFPLCNLHSCEVIGGQSATCPVFCTCCATLHSVIMLFCSRFWSFWCRLRFTKSWINSGQVFPGSPRLLTSANPPYKHTEGCGWTIHSPQHTPYRGSWAFASPAPTAACLTRYSITLQLPLINRLRITQ